jgi:hypothetical protein
MVAILEINENNRLIKALDFRKRIAVLVLIICIVLYIIKLLESIDILWWLNIIGLVLNLFAALMIGKGTTIEISRGRLPEDGSTYRQELILFRIGTNLLLAGFSLQLLSLIIPASF